MKYKQLNENWNADPNGPNPTIDIKGNTLHLEFYLNSYVYDHIKENQKGILIFSECSMYRLGSVNDEGFYRGQFRYHSEEIEWGEFYQLFNSNWQKEFPNDQIILQNKINTDSKHYLFFFRDNEFECISNNFEFKILE